MTVSHAAMNWAAYNIVHRVVACSHKGSVDEHACERCGDKCYPEGLDGNHGGR